MITLEKAVTASASAFEVSKDSLRAKSRKLEFKFARYCAIRLAKEEMPSLSYETIGDYFNIHRTNVYNVMHRVNEYIETKDPIFYKHYRKAKQIFKEL